MNAILICTGLTYQCQCQANARKLTKQICDRYDNRDLIIELEVHNSFVLSVFCMKVCMFVYKKKVYTDDFYQERRSITSVLTERTVPGGERMPRKQAPSVYSLPEIRSVWTIDMITI